MSTYQLPAYVGTVATGTDKSSDHELSGRLSRGGFAKLLWAALEEVPVNQRSQIADSWCEQLMHVARLRRINWWPSLGSATTAVAVMTSAVQSALEEVLDATPAPHRREAESGPSDSALASAIAAHRDRASMS